VKPTRVRTLLLIGVLAAAVTWALLIPLYAKLPPLTWTGSPIPSSGVAPATS